MSDKEKLAIYQKKLEVALNAIHFIYVDLEDMKWEAYMDSSNSYPDEEKGAYYSGKYQAYLYASQMVQSKIECLNEV